MLTILTDREVTRCEAYELVFDMGGGYSYAFPCDEAGNVGDMAPEARANYARLTQEGRVGEVERYTQDCVTPATAECKCGSVLHLDGDVECYTCGRLYNTFGQEIRSW